MIYIITIDRVRKEEDTIIAVYTNIGIFTRKEIVNEIERGILVYTRTSNGLGAKVHIFNYDGEKYIRTSDDCTIENNLDNLPLF